MPDPRILLCAGAGDSAAGLESLTGVRWPGAFRHVITTGKFDTRKLAATCNIEVGYPAETAWLATLSSWATPSDKIRTSKQDALSLFALRKIIADGGALDYAVIVGDENALPSEWAEAQALFNGRSFVAVGHPDRPNILFDLTHRSTAPLLEGAWELYLSGAVFALEPYSFAAVLLAAEQAMVAGGLITGDVP